MEVHERARLRKYQATPTDVTEEQRKLTGPNSAFINCIRDTIRATPGTYESLVQLLLSMEAEMLDTTSDTNNSSPRSEWSSVTMVAPPRSPMQELPRARRMVPGVFLGSYTNTYVPGPVYTNCDWTGTMPSFEQWQTVVEYDDRMDVDVNSSSHSDNGGGEDSGDANLEASNVHQTEEQERYEPMEIEMDIDGEEQQQQHQFGDQQQCPGEEQHAEEQKNAEEQQQHAQEQQDLEEGQHQQEEQPEDQQQPFHPQPSPTTAQPNEYAKEQQQQQQEEQQDEEPVRPQPFRPQHSPTAAQLSNENAEDQQEEQPVHPQPSQTTTQSNERAAPASPPDAQPALPAPDFLADPFAGTESRTNQFIRTMGEAAMLIRELRYGRNYVQSGALIPSTSCEGYQEFRRRLEAGMRMSPHNSMKKCFDEVEICLEMIVDCLVVAQVLEMVQNWSAWGVNPFG